MQSGRVDSFVLATALNLTSLAECTKAYLLLPILKFLLIDSYRIRP